MQSDTERKYRLSNVLGEKCPFTGVTLELYYLYILKAST